MNAWMKNKYFCEVPEDDQIQWRVWEIQSILSTELISGCSSYYADLLFTHDFPRKYNPFIQELNQAKGLPIIRIINKAIKPYKNQIINLPYSHKRGNIQRGKEDTLLQSKEILPKIDGNHRVITLFSTCKW